MRTHASACQGPCAPRRGVSHMRRKMPVISDLAGGEEEEEEGVNERTRRRNTWQPERAIVPSSKMLSGTLQASKMDSIFPLV